jgi:hypothetical protein
VNVHGIIIPFPHRSSSSSASFIFYSYSSSRSLIKKERKRRVNMTEAGPLIGVLALQGAFEEHQHCLEAIGCRTVQVRYDTIRYDAVFVPLRFELHVLYRSRVPVLILKGLSHHYRYIFLLYYRSKHPRICSVARESFFRVESPPPLVSSERRRERIKPARICGNPSKNSPSRNQRGVRAPE